MTKSVTTNEKTPAAKKGKHSESKHYADVSLSASYMAAIISDSFTHSILPKAELVDVANALTDKIKEVQDGNMQPIEAMLISQAQALQTMFVTLGRMAANKTQLAQYTAFMNMALKAQSQSRATIQALIELKYPKHATFVKQANISHGHQQVNNHDNTDSPARVEKLSNQSNELLEVNHGSQTMDVGTAKTAGNQDKAVAAVAK